jgi:hypothetical protein
MTRLTARDCLPSLPVNAHTVHLPALAKPPRRRVYLALSPTPGEV